jgi:hypothetical protein
MPKNITGKPEQDMLSGHSEQMWSCELSPEDKSSYGIKMVDIRGVDKAVIDSHQPYSGSSIFRVSEGVVQGRFLLVPSNAMVEIDNPPPEGRRHLASKTGTLKTLVIRVIGNNGQSPPTFSKADAIDDMFTDGVSLKTQFAACSYNQLTIQPYSGTTTKGVAITGGVVDVKIPDNPVEGSDLETSANNAAKALFGDLESQFDLVVSFASYLGLGGGGGV